MSKESKDTETTTSHPRDQCKRQQRHENNATRKRERERERIGSHWLTADPREEMAFLI